MSAIRKELIDWVPSVLESMGRYFSASVYGNSYGNVAPSRSIYLHPCAGIAVLIYLVNCIGLICIDKASFIYAYITESTPPWECKRGPILPRASPNKNLSCSIGITKFLPSVSWKAAMLSGYSQDVCTWSYEWTPAKISQQLHQFSSWFYALQQKWDKSTHSANKWLLLAQRKTLQCSVLSLLFAQF